MSDKINEESKTDEKKKSFQDVEENKEGGEGVKTKKERRRQHHRALPDGIAKGTPAHPFFSPPAAPTITETAAKGFDVIVRGVLEGAECHSADMLFARTFWVHGKDWTELTDVPQTTSFTTSARPLVMQVERRAPSEVVTQLSCVSRSPFARFTWAAPFECALRSTNPHGWPQLVVTLHTVLGATPKSKPPHEIAAAGGLETCISYSRCFIPLRGGTYRRKLPLMQLAPNTKKLAWIGWWTGEQVELRDPAFLCSGEDRSVLKAVPLPGHVVLSFSVVVSGFSDCGFEP